MPLDRPAPLAASSQRLPLFLSPIAAGFPSPADDYVEAELSLDELCIRHPAATFLLRARGDSMEGAGIFDGDVLVVDRSLSPRAGQVVVALIQGSFTCKHLEYEDGLPLLRAANPRYADIRLASAEELEVFGVVTTCIHRLAP